MLERARSVGHPREICQGWVTFRGLQSGRRFLANFRLPPEKGSPAVGWIWNDGERKPAAKTGLQFTSDSSAEGKEPVAPRTISALDGSFHITRGALLYRYSFIDELGPLLGGIVNLVVGNPITNYYDAQVQVSPDKPLIEGVLELMHIE